MRSQPTTKTLSLRFWDYPAWYMTLIKFFLKPSYCLPEPFLAVQSLFIVWGALTCVYARQNLEYLRLFLRQRRAELSHCEQIVRGNYCIIEPSHEIMALFVLHKLILQTCIRSHPVGLDVWFLFRPFICFHTLCVRTVKALVAYVISTIISWAGSSIQVSQF